jgi:hypothetical protein
VVDQQLLIEGVGLETGAIFSDCRRWRYVLWRVWDWRLRLLLSISLNPSVADELRNDRTVSKMMKYARLWGFGGLIKLNAYGWRSKSPAEMKKQGVQAIGDLNDFWTQQVWKVFGPEGRDQIGLSVASWGQHDFLDRGSIIREYIPNLHHLGLNQNGTPTHPLYLPMTIKPMPFDPVVLQAASSHALN